MEDRYWIDTTPLDEDGPLPWGADTYAVVDECRGGVILYVHKDNAARVLDALRKGA